MSVKKDNILLSLVELEARREMAWAEYEDYCEQIAHHPDQVRKLLGPAMCRRFVDTGRLKHVSVDVTPRHQATVELTLDGIQYKLSYWYNTREEEWQSTDNGPDLQDVSPEWQSTSANSAWRTNNKALQETLAAITMPKYWMERHGPQQLEALIIASVLIYGIK